MAISDLRFKNQPNDHIPETRCKSGTDKNFDTKSNKNTLSITEIQKSREKLTNMVHLEWKSEERRNVTKFFIEEQTSNKCYIC